MKFLKDAKLRAGSILREWKEKREEHKAQKQRALPQGASPLLWCIFITLVGVFALGGSTWMLAVFIAGSVGHLDWVSDYVTTQAGVQHWEYTFEASVHWFNAIGLWLLCAAIGIFNAAWIELRKHFFGVFQKWITGLGIATAVFMVSGGVVVQQRGTDARTRDEVAAVGTAQAGVAAIDAEIGALTQRWETLCAANLTTYQAQACRSGETAWRERIETARTQRDYQLPGIERALADAREGDRMQARLLELRTQRAQASVQTVEAETTTVRAEGWMAPIVAFIEDLRKPVTSVLGELLAMSAFPMALAAWATRRRRRDVESSGWAPEGLRIEDLRDEEPIAKGTATMQTVMEEEDLATGEKKRMIKPKPYWRTVKKGKKQRIEVPPEMVEDENGVYTDGGNRTATAGVTLGGRMELAAAVVAEPDVTQDVQTERTTEHKYAGDTEVQADEHDKGGGASGDREGHDASPRFDGGVDGASNVDQTEPPIDFEELAAQVAEESVAPIEQPDAERADDDNGGGDVEASDDSADDVADHTDPQPEQREDRMLAPPSVAAE